jgi:phage FluMu protein Com
MDEEVTCPWCEKKVVPELRILERANGFVKERRCEQCGKLLAAYLDGEVTFLKGIRKFEN